MSWIEQERKIQMALSFMKKQQANIGAPKSRLHEQGMVDRVARIKALENGPCRICQSLNIENNKERGMVIVSLRCEQGESPLDLHRPFVTKLGEVPKCNLLIPFDRFVKAGILE